MATNKYVDSTLNAGSKVLPGTGFPGTVLRLQGTYEKTAADNDTSILRLGKVPITAQPLYHASKINNDALTGASAVNIGIYKCLSAGGGGGDVIDMDLLSASLNIASGNALASPAAAFQTRPTIEQFGLSLKALAEAALSTTIYDQEVDIALTGTTFGTAAGTIAWDLSFLIPQA